VPRCRKPRDRPNGGVSNYPIPPALLLTILGLKV